MKFPYCRDRKEKYHHIRDDVWDTAERTRFGRTGAFSSSCGRPHSKWSAHGEQTDNLADKSNNKGKYQDITHFFCHI